MATDQATTNALTIHLPITGKRDGRYGVVVGHAIVLDDDFTRNELLIYRWCSTKAGYPKRDVNRKCLYLHRIVFVHYHGPIPLGMEVDHIDRDLRNVIPSNLRAITHSRNIANGRTHIDNASGFKGVSWDCTSGNFQARIMVEGHRISLGRFPTAEEAAVAVNNAYRTNFPGIAVPNPGI